MGLLEGSVIFFQNLEQVLVDLLSYADVRIHLIIQLYNDNIAYELSID